MMDFDSRLLVKFLIEELSLDELELLMKWRECSDENEKIFAYLIRLKISYRYLQDNTEEKIEQGLKKVNRRIDRKPSLMKGWRFWKYAAAFILLISLCYGSWRYFPRPETFLTITVKEG